MQLYLDGKLPNLMERLELKAEIIPELTLSGGYLRNNETHENAVIAGLAIGLPVFNRNRGAILSREYEAHAAGEESQGACQERITEASVILSEIETIDKTRVFLRETLLRKAEKIYALLEGYYKKGNISILEVLESRKTILEINMRCVELITEKALLAADLMEVSGITLQIVR